MDTNQHELPKMPGLEKPRPGFFVSGMPPVPDNCSEVTPAQIAQLMKNGNVGVPASWPQCMGAISTYVAIRPCAPEPFYVMRAFALHRRRFELLHLATFYFN